MSSPDDPSALPTKNQSRLELESLVIGLEKIFGHRKTITAQTEKKWSARRARYSVEELQIAFANLLNEPDTWKLQNNGQRPLSWWLHSDERIEEMKFCHLKRS